MMSLLISSTMCMRNHVRVICDLVQAQDFGISAIHGESMQQFQPRKKHIPELHKIYDYLLDKSIKCITTCYAFI